MENNLSFYSWFKKVIAIFIEIFFVGAILSTLYVFTYPFDEKLKIFVFIGILVVFGIIVFFFRNKVKIVLNKVLLALEKLDSKKMIIIIILTMVLLKVIYTILFYFDPTSDGDIKIYVDLADSILETGTFANDSIKHIVGTALHFCLFRIINVPLHIGMFVIYLIGTVINFFTFKDIVGKEKSFLLIMLYVLMPSTILLTYCPTHELLVYLYYSLFIFSLNRLLASKTKKGTLLYSILLLFALFMACFVNPSGTILYIVIGLIIVLSNVEKIKKLLLVAIIVICIVLSNSVPKMIGLSDRLTKANDYTVLICGASVETRGEHVDHYPQDKAGQYIVDNDIEHTYDGYLIALRAILFDEYKYLFTHPIEFGKLLVHKFYVEWSGDHYSLEMAHSYNGVSDIIYYLFLGLSAVIYLLVLTIGFVFNTKKDDNIFISNIKLMLLGVMALLLISLVLNKYSVYMTIFIYLIAFYRADLSKK